ncbi:hypothetical protein [Caldicellulosiruptor acetigenus]|uniref:Uncharacterized protein n=1 Tax=Caldicellulosiruptor acetigenus 6A TaxID=632516 RepID=G2PXC1_9FIRM|nr:hypothetical protein [Caldicellulosiruptor acetigenus]AEM74785.1 hypothetical protein Calla_2240 [Caldicellulosiruptor acetigenus 6A]
MSDYIEEMPHDEMVKNYFEGKILLGVEPAAARKFIMSISSQSPNNSFYIVTSMLMSNDNIIALKKAKIFINIVFSLSLVTLFAFIIISIVNFKWIGIVIDIVFIVALIIYSSYVSMGKQTLSRIVIVTILCFLIAFYTKNINDFLFYFIMPLPFLFTRLSYYFSVSFIRNLALKDQGFYIKALNRIIFLKKVKQT